MTSLEIGTPATVPCGGGTLAFESGGQVSMSGPAGVPRRSASVPDLALSNYVELWCGGEYAYFAGLEGRAVWFARPDTGELAEILELDRLDLSGHYDPGGLHDVGFRELPDGDVLIVYELGVARVRPDGTVCWHRSHDDLTAHVARIADGVIWWAGESQEFGYSLADGHQIV
jgi:hypothetical protein